MASRLHSQRVLCVVLLALVGGQVATMASNSNMPGRPNFIFFQPGG